ncbi:MAG: GAF domain-containing protein, partial [Anaerolineales bacterium]|nr:GAF domain-containing protein [Anaerolineales bacterium]
MVFLLVRKESGYVNGIITEADLPSGSTYTVIDRNGIILARHPDPEQWVGQPASDVPIVDQILSQQSEGTLDAVGLDGVQRLYAYVPLIDEPDISAYVLVGIPKTVAYTDVNWVLVTNLIGLGLATAIALVIAWIGGYVFIVRRVDILVQATERLKAGDLSVRTGLPDGIGKLNQLGQAFDQMAEAMQAHDAEIQQANLSLRRANRALSVLSDCNQALIRTENEPDFLDEICRIICQVGGYRLAWVGYAEDDEEKTVRPVAQAGYEDGYFDTINITWADTAEGQGPTGTAIRTGKPVISRDILNDPNFAPWREQALKRGYASSIAIPLIANGRHLGALNIYTTEVDAFNPDEIQLLEELAMDLAFGIKMLRIRAQHQKAEEKIQIQLKNLSALRQIDMAISASLDLRVTLNVLLDQVCNTLGADASCVLLLQPHTQVFEFTTGRGFYTEALRHTSLRFGEGHAGLAALERRIVNIPDLFGSENGLQRSVLLSGEEFITYHAVPLVAKGKVKGVMEIFHRTRFEPDQEWLDFLDALAAQAAIAIENAALFDDVQQSNVELMMAYDTTLEGWSRALELRDHETEGHTKRVAKVTINLARALKIKEADLVHVHRGAILHDIGKMGIPDDILLKPGPLSEEEWKLMHQHPTLAFKLLSPIAYLRPALDIPYCHHEKWDGTGY